MDNTKFIKYVCSSFQQVNRNFDYVLEKQNKQARRTGITLILVGIGLLAAKSRIDELERKQKELISKMGCMKTDIDLMKNKGALNLNECSSDES